MENSEQSRKYELVVIVDAKLSGDAKEAVRKNVTDLINKHGGKVINSQVWLEKHRFTFEIKKCHEGSYYIINFEGDGSIVEKMKPTMRLNEKILRFVFIKVESKNNAPKAAAQAV